MRFGWEGGACQLVWHSCPIKPCQTGLECAALGTSWVLSTVP